jgi:hypothetical protein
VAQLLDEMPSSELAEWMAFASIEPFGGAVDDLRAGLAPAVALNLNRTKDADPISPMTFFPWADKAAAPEPEPETPEQISEKLRALLTAKANPNGNV